MRKEPGLIRAQTERWILGAVDERHATGIAQFHLRNMTSRHENFRGETDIHGNDWFFRRSGGQRGAL
jgi:hypothetical protein